jgi:menaquinone-specific isochorismate synthase
VNDLVASTSPLAEGPDLGEVAGEGGVLFEREGAGLAGTGVAMALDLPRGLSCPGDRDRVTEALATIKVEDEVGIPGTGPVALGALPFDGGSPARLTVPALTVGRDREGRAWQTVVAPAGSPLLRTTPPSSRPGAWPPERFRLESVVSHEEWCARVGRAVAEVRRGRLEKVVLAREVVVHANRDLIVSDVLGRLRALYPSCTIFSVGGFVGASPELLASRRGAEVRSHPLAGTVARSGDPATDDSLTAALLASAKDTAEHRVVVQAVVDALSQVCAEMDVPPAPSIVSLRNVSHLGTLVKGRLGSPWPSALELAARLHPTPAVAGTPRPAALDLIAELEGMDRGRYAGPVGWVDSRGDGDWVLGIRSATIRGKRARLLAGVGIVADSDPRDELTETQLKLQALLAALVRP